MNTAEDKDEFLLISKNSPGLKGLADTEGLAVALLLDSSISMEKAVWNSPVCASEWLGTWRSRAAEV